MEKTCGAYTSLRGVRTYDATDPSSPKLLQEFSVGTTGGGTHANFYDGGTYAYLDCGWDETLRMESSERPFSNALMIVDLSDPANIREVSRWWVPGQKFVEEAEYKCSNRARWSGGRCRTSTQGGTTVRRAACIWRGH